MRYNSSDKTLERNMQDMLEGIIKEYEEIDRKRHPQYRFKEELYKAHNISRQKFHKIYSRYKATGDRKDLLPQKKGPRYKSRRTDIKIEKEVIEEREKGLNKMEICDILTSRHKERVISPSGIYNVLKRYGKNVLRREEKQAKRKMIQKRKGELGHIDCHYLHKGVIEGNTKQYYLVCVLDGYSRIAWAEVTEDIKSITVMFAVLRLFGMIGKNYSIEFEAVLTDNGAEFASRQNKHQHAFERMLVEMDIKHKYTRPYRPQTNGKVERFWRTLKEDLLDTMIWACQVKCVS